MTSNLLGISITGLRVSQQALSTTGHNIANAGVDGYSRQRVDAATNPATLQGAGYVGNGVSVEAIERIADDFVANQLRLDTALFNDLDIYHGNIAQLDSLLADPSTGLSNAMDSFFASMQNGTDDPTSIPARQLILSEAENLSDRFNTLYSRFESINEGVDTSIKSAVAQINALSSNIAELNRKVSEALGEGNDSSPNDLLDQRDEALRELSKLVEIQTFDQGFGEINVVIAGGQNLVIGNESRELLLTISDQDPAKQDVVFQDGTSQINVTSLVNGGELGGLLRFQNSIMDEAYNELGRIAIALADTMNEVHTQGITLNNEFGGNFFYDVNDTTIARNRVIANSDNAEPQDRILSLNIEDSNQMTASDYVVTVESGGLFRISRSSDDVEVGTGLLTGAYPQSISFDGLELVFEDGSFQAGDSFRLQPTKSGARDFSASLVNPSDIAFASPILTDASLGNTGTGEISSGDILSIVDQDGNTLPLFASPGELSPPLAIIFTSDNTYDVMDVSDPSNPVHLDPPLRNQTYIVGAEEPIFPSDPGGTQVSSNGDLIGLPSGRRPVNNAAILLEAPSTAPDYTTTNFSGTADQFSFDVVVSGTTAGVNDGTFTVNVAGPALVDDDSLVAYLNAQLSGSNVRAYIADNGTMAFRLDTPGYGDITIQNYNGDPDGGADVAPVGQANNLLGFDIEGSTFTTIGDADGVSGDGELNNGYPAEVITITRPSTVQGEADITQNLFTGLQNSAREIAEILNNEPGVSANAFNYIELTNMQVTGAYPLQIQFNGEDLIPYEIDSLTGQPTPLDIVPNPQTDPNAFNDYLAERINENRTFQDQGIYAVAAGDATTGEPELRIFATLGDDLEVSLTAAAGETIGINDGTNENVSLVGSGNSTTSSVVVGGQFDVSLAEGITLSTFPPNSMLFGDTSAADFAKSSFLGIQTVISGIPKGGDIFNINFNLDAASDNRNALSLSNLALENTMNDGKANYADSYASLVEVIGIETNATRINLDASEQVLEQTTELRDSVSSVNLDEEASNLLKFEQMYSANAQVISVARDLFDTLLASF